MEHEAPRDATAESGDANRTGPLSSAARTRRYGWLLFFALWALYGALTNSRDLYYWSLHYRAAEAMVERHHFYLLPHVPGKPIGTDVVVYNGLIYPNKQPGSLMAGAFVYAVLYWIGFTYRDTFFLTAALVSFFTSALCTAIAAMVVFRLAAAWSKRLWWALGCALAFGIGSTALPYAGTLQHDAMASAFLLLAFFFAERRPFATGLFAGLAVTTSALPIPAATAVVLYSLWRNGRGRLLALLLGSVLGLLPMLVYNSVSFGNPLAAAVAGSAAGGSPTHVGAAIWQRLAGGPTVRRWHTLTYHAKALTWYAPIAWAGILGLCFFPRRLRREQILLASLILLEIAYLVVLGQYSNCQYGPRYLLAIMPFAALGLTGYAHIPYRRAAAVLLLALGCFSATVNVVGAMYGTMFCDPNRWAFAHYADAIRHRVFPSYPLLGIHGRDPRRSEPM